MNRIWLFPRSGSVLPNIVKSEFQEIAFVLNPNEKSPSWEYNATLISFFMAMLDFKPSIVDIKLTGSSLELL